MFVSSRETISNQKLIIAAMILYKRNLLEFDAVRMALNTYAIQCREAKSDYL